MSNDRETMTRREEHFRQTLGALGRTLAMAQTRPLNEAERTGLVQFYALAWDLAWKIWGDRLRAEGILVQSIAPANIFRAAFTAGWLQSPDDWTRARRLRNQLIHIYDDSAVDEAILAIRDTFFPLLRNWDRAD